ncbi:MAG: hypothetical protein H0U27_06545 [Nitrosopumilus sp.]|nr:hypothetical protein [Nitrosopumilus sp.]
MTLGGGLESGSLISYYDIIMPELSTARHRMNTSPFTWSVISSKCHLSPGTL